MDRSLTKPQLTALFNILTHAAASSEVESFKRPATIANYGPPFSEPGDSLPARTSPILQTLLHRFVLPAPAVRDLPPEFWTERVQGLLAGLAEADLSESYEKGSVGTRRTLGTGASVIIEGVARGCLGGYPVAGLRGEEDGDAESRGQEEQGQELEAGWDELARGFVHGDLIDGLCEWLEGTDDLEGTASILHHIFAVTSEGQYLLKVLQNAHKLIPYAMIRQILRLGNAATMLNSLLKLLLAKFGLGTLSNWAGFTQNADEGMNLLQRIEKAKDAPSTKQLKALRKHVQGPREAREEARRASVETSRSIVLIILDSADADGGLSASLSEEQHRLCLQYYAAILSMRDRDEMIRVLCRSNPDLLSQAVREVVGVYEPMIRDVHATIDLSEHLDNVRAFIDDFLVVSASKKEDGEGKKYRLPTVEDYVELLRRHRGSVYSWLHQVSDKCPQVRDQVRDWAKDASRSFRPEESPGNINGTSILDRLEALFAALPDEKQGEIRPVLDQHATYLASLETASTDRIRTIARGDGPGTAAGPGAYLAGWQSLLDNTPITPGVKGGARVGRDVLDRTTPGKTGTSGEISWDGNVDARDGMAEIEQEEEMAPDGRVVVEALGGEFHLLLKEVAIGATGMGSQRKGHGKGKGEVREQGK
ncbi:uncharacterized protein DNG_02017 [Cephalotrichum gorgonifer]|uniref:Uncharacterized protein n=1 Tax=Cephalotrichum gorgonifer TaxID=2041049 RepID=A0AAE8MRT8_9PEZI|nr:uncharacterized protein DNG_02017 [Cephalotrichum gorgonifer]